MANFKKPKVPNTTMRPMLNHEGTTVHELNDLEALFSQTLGSFFGEGTFYENRDAGTAFVELYERIQCVSKRDKEYVLKIAELGRLCNMIEYPLQIFVAACNTDMFLGNNFLDEKTGKNKLQSYAPRLMLRAKDLTNVISTQFALADLFEDTEKGLPMQLKKAVRARLEAFDKFKLSKGLSKNSSVTLADVINLTHPRPRNDEYKQFFKDILDGKVKVGDDKPTLNTALTQKGQQKTDDNTEIITAVRTENLMNIVKNLVALYRTGVFNDNDTLSNICDRLSDPAEVTKSKLLPFRFLSAYTALDNSYGNRDTKVERLKSSLSTALNLAADNAPAITGRTCVLVDVSGSMKDSISQKSSESSASIAGVLGGIAYKRSEGGDLFAFATNCERVDISRDAMITDISNTIHSKRLGSGTNVNDALRVVEGHAEETGTRYDNLIVLTDCDCYGYTSNNRHGYTHADGQVNDLLKKGVFRKIWVNNLCGNNFVIVNTAQHTKNLVTGFSEKFLEVINTYNALGGSSDIRKVIDEMLEKKRKL